MSEEDKELIDLLQRSCESSLLVNSSLVEQRLKRFARQAAPVVHRRRLHIIAVFASVFVLGTAGTAAAALHGGIRIGGVRLLFVKSNPVPTSQPVRSVTLPGSELQWPGEPVTLEEARNRYKARILLPRALRTPSSVYWLVPPSSGQVTAVWKPQKDLPETDDPKVGLLLTQFRGRSTDQAIMTKVQAGSRGSSKLEQVTVKKTAGWFISGPKHVVVLNDEQGIRVETARLAGNTLLWTAGEFTYRLEGNMTKATALRIANSVR